MFDKAEEKISYLLPPAIPVSTEEARRTDYEWKETEVSLVGAVGAWLRDIGIAHAVESVPAVSGVRLRVTLPNQPPHDITEVGFGVSQILPVLVAGLLQPRNSLFVVDLPEAHLHPLPQGFVADFFCSLALSGRFALVETHSEMFFHRLRLRAAMSPRLMESIAVYFIDPPRDGLCSAPRRVGLGFEDELHWPEGFLHETWETEIQIKTVRQARGES